MIAAQKEALEAARRSREDALKATKVGDASSVRALITQVIYHRSKAISLHLWATSWEHLSGMICPLIINPTLIYGQFFLWAAWPAQQYRARSRPERNWWGVRDTCFAWQSIWNGNEVQTAKQSCELLLKVCYLSLGAYYLLFTNVVQIIDSILDYSKLEASGWLWWIWPFLPLTIPPAVKLEPSGFLVEVCLQLCHFVIKGFNVFI